MRGVAKGNRKGNDSVRVEVADFSLLSQRFPDVQRALATLNRIAGAFLAFNPRDKDANLKVPFLACVALLNRDKNSTLEAFAQQLEKSADIARNASSRRSTNKHAIERTLEQWREWCAAREFRNEQDKLEASDFTVLINDGYPSSYRGPAPGTSWKRTWIE